MSSPVPVEAFRRARKAWDTWPGTRPNDVDGRLYAALLAATGHTHGNDGLPIAPPPTVVEVGDAVGAGAAALRAAAHAMQVLPGVHGVGRDLHITADWLDRRAETLEEARR